jgi:glucose/arabinose dehydrogenase
MPRVTWAVLLAALLTASCSAAPTSSAMSTKPATRSAGPTSSPTGSARQACRPSQPVTRPAGIRSTLPVLTLATGLAGADDLLAEPHPSGTAGDRLLVGELDAGRIAVLGGGTGASRLAAHVPTVEGLAEVGGVLYAADQRDDRVDRLDADGSVRTVLQLRPVPGVEGLDGLSSDGRDLLVPDSPRGEVLVVDLSGRVLRRVGGFARPTGAWALADGSLLVADENAGQVVRVSPDGARAVLARGLTGADDVVATQSGTVWAIGIGGGVLARVQDGRAVTVASGFGHPQGLALDAAGNVDVADLATGAVSTVVTAMALPPATAVTVAAGQPLCVDLLRAPGFTGRATLSVGPGGRVVADLGGGTRGAVVPPPCPGHCTLLVRATSGSLEVSRVLTYSTAG